MKNLVITFSLLAVLLLNPFTASAVTVVPAASHHSMVAPKTNYTAYHALIFRQLADEGKSQTNAFIFALLGLLVIPLGWQRYYLGYKKEGIIMTILALTVIGWPVAWVWTLIDLIKILDGSLKPADGSEYTDFL